MRLPQATIAATLAIRQLPALLPSEFCNPICPSCRTDVTLFNQTTSCISNSSFLNDCSGCQQCIIKYQLEQGSQFDGSIYQMVLKQVLNLCSDSTVSNEVASLQSQASRLSMLADTRTSSAITTATSAPTALITPSPSTLIPTTPTLDEDTAPLGKSWIAGPILGSILGLATVYTVIYCTRKQQQRQAIIYPFPLEAKKADDGSESGDSRGVSPQPQLEPVEVETIEVYELPASEPVGIELHTPMKDKMDEEAWPLPMPPLRAMFAETEMRDERRGDKAPQHQTYYNP